MIGPWTIKTQNGKKNTFSALTIIDTATNLCEIIRIENKTAFHVGAQFEMAWLSRYPKPLHCIYDAGGEFLGYAFQRVLHNYGIQGHASTVKNPQSNSIVEHVHQTIGNCIRAQIHDYPVQNMQRARETVDTALATAQYAVRTTIHKTLKLSPGAIAFGRDMLLNIPLIADFKLLRDRRQAVINANLAKENKRRIQHDYQPGDQVLKAVWEPTKLEPRFEGPYTLTKVHVNGNVTMQVTPHTTERLNVRRIKPYRVPT